MNTDEEATDILEAVGLFVREPEPEPEPVEEAFLNVERIFAGADRGRPLMCLRPDQLYLTTLPADGFFVQGFDADGILGGPTPVLGFLVFRSPDGSMSVFPATCAEVYDADKRGFVVVEPGGAVLTASGERYASVEDFEKSLKPCLEVVS